MTALTLRYIKGDFVVTGPDIEPIRFKTRREAKDWCVTHYPGSPILLMGMVREAKKIADENKIPELEGFSPEMTDDGMVRHPSFKRLVP
jgi:hypothetical protein